MKEVDDVSLKLGLLKPTIQSLFEYALKRASERKPWQDSGRELDIYFYFGSLAFDSSVPICGRIPTTQWTLLLLGIIGIRRRSKQK